MSFPCQAQQHDLTRRLPAGFTLIELVTSLVIVSVLSAIGYAYLQSVQAQATSRASISDVVSMLQLTRTTAIAQGVQTVFLLQPDPAAQPAQLQYLAFIDKQQSFNPATPTFAVPTGDQLLEQGRLDPSVLFKLNTSSIFQTAAPAPLQAIPATSQCTFCDVTAGNVTVVFRSDGTAALGSNPTNYLFGGSFTLTSFGKLGAGSNGDGDGRTALALQTILLSSRTGAVFPWVRL